MIYGKGVGGDDPGLPQDPVYVQGKTRDEYWAHFRAGAVVQVGRGRIRAYPHLAGTAPPTQSFYLAFAELPTSFRHVLDIGCGSGIGLKLLQGRYARITGLDVDARAIAFAKQYAKHAEFIHASGSSSFSTTLVDAALVIDVLGFLEQPEQLLRELTRHLHEEACLWIAEPQASPQQRLDPPLRRAWSTYALTALLARAGFVVSRRFNDTGSFSLVEAKLFSPSAGLAFGKAEKLCETGEFSPALTLLDSVRAIPQGEILLEALLLEAQIYASLEQRDRANASLIEAHHLSPNDPRPIAGMARLAFLNNSLEQAFELAVEAVRRDPTEVVAVYILGEITEALGKNETLELWNTARVLAPDSGEITQRFCRVALAQGKTQQAIEALENLCAFEGRYSRFGASVHLALGWLLADKSNSLRAMQETRIAERSLPQGTELETLRRYLAELARV